MLDTKRHWFKGIEKGVGKTFGVLPVTPNQITMISGVAAMGGLFFMTQKNLEAAVVFFVVAGGLDFVDGAVARLRGIASRSGAYLDTILDRYVEGMIFLGMIFLDLPEVILPGVAWVFLAFFGSIVTTYAKAAAKEKELVNQELKGGLLSRGERLGLIFVALGFGIYDPSYMYMTYVIVVIAILANVTAFQRIWSAIRLNR